MRKRRIRRTANIQQPPPPLLVPSYYPYPSYEHPPPQPTYNPTPSYQPTKYIFYPVDENGQMLGPPALLPPIQNRRYSQPDRHSEHHSNRSSKGSYRRPPTQNQRPPPPVDVYDQPPPQTHRTYEALPPINRNPFASTRRMSPNYEEYQQFAVRDLTERGSASSRLSSSYAIHRVQYYDQLQKNYH